jgi:nitrite reductase/ring-hydroxylating ferredoxin subunit
MNDQAADFSKWLKIASVSDVPEDGTLQCRMGTQAICLYNVNGMIYATDDVCSHGDASLSDGFIVNGDQIECPYHQGRFSVVTGKAVGAPCVEDIRAYSVRIQQGAVFLNADEFMSPLL